MQSRVHLFPPIPKTLLPSRLVLPFAGTLGNKRIYFFFFFAGDGVLALPPPLLPPQLPFLHSGIRSLPSDYSFSSVSRLPTISPCSSSGSPYVFLFARSSPHPDSFHCLPPTGRSFPRFIFPFGTDCNSPVYVDFTPFLLSPIRG